MFYRLDAKTSLCLGATLATLTPLAQADFIDDSHANLALRNFYYHRDLDAGRDDLNEWAQAFALNFKSGYTDGTVGVGLDATGWLGLKLDSGGGSSGTGILPKGASGEAPDSYSRLGLTGKLRYSQTELKIGSHQPRIPLLMASDARLLPQTFNGVSVESREVDGLLLTAGGFNRTTDRAQAGSDKMTMSGSDVRRFGLSGVDGDRFNYVGAEYRLNPSVQLRAYHGGLEDYYRQTFVGSLLSLPISDQQALSLDLRYFRSTDDGHTHVQQVDNHTYGALLTYQLAAHAFSAGIQRVSGETGFTYVAGTDAYVINSIQWGNFSSAQEHSWQLKYAYDFSGLGVPGLTFMTRYVYGDNIERDSQPEGKEWERNTDIAYVVQSGTFKNLSITLRNASYRNNFSSNLDETRLIVNYRYDLF